MSDYVHYSIAFDSLSDVTEIEAESLSKDLEHAIYTCIFNFNKGIDIKVEIDYSVSQSVLNISIDDYYNLNNNFKSDQAVRSQINHIVVRILQGADVFEEFV